MSSTSTVDAMDRRTFGALIAGRFDAEEAAVLAVVAMRKMTRGEVGAVLGDADEGEVARWALAAIERLVKRSVLVEAGGVYSLAPAERWCDAGFLAWLDRAAAASPPSALPPVLRDHTSKKKSPPPSVPPRWDGRAAADRARIVFGPEAADRIERRWPSIMDSLQGNALAFMAAMAKCEIDEFQPDDPIAFLLRISGKYLDEVPDWLAEQLARKPKPIKPPKPTPRYFSAAQVDFNPPDAAPPGTLWNTVQEVMRRMREGELPPTASLSQPNPPGGTSVPPSTPSGPLPAPGRVAASPDPAP